MRWMFWVVLVGCGSDEGSDTGTCDETVERHVRVPDESLDVYCDVVLCCDGSVVSCRRSEDDLLLEGGACEADCAETMTEALADCD